VLLIEPLYPCTKPEPNASFLISQRLIFIKADWFCGRCFKSEECLQILAEHCFGGDRIRNVVSG